MDETDRLVAQGRLYDFYGQLLNAHQRRIYEKVVYENLSLGEIAEAEGTSRQAVHDLIRRTTAILEGYEEKLGLIARFDAVREEAKTLRSAARKAAERAAEDTARSPARHATENIASGNEEDLTATCFAIADRLEQIIR